MRFAGKEIGGGSNPEEYNEIKDEKDFLSKAQAWQYVYNVKDLILVKV